MLMKYRKVIPAPLVPEDVVLVDAIVPVCALAALSIRREDSSISFGAIEQRSGGMLKGKVLYLPELTKGTHWEIVQDDKGYACLALVRDNDDKGGC